MYRYLTKTNLPHGQAFNIGWNVAICNLFPHSLQYQILRSTLARSTLAGSTLAGSTLAGSTLASSTLGSTAGHRSHVARDWATGHIQQLGSIIIIIIIIIIHVAGILQHRDKN